MHVDRRNTRADHFEITDTLSRKDGSPVLVNVPGGRVVVKEIEYTTTMCPECTDEEDEHTVAAWTDDKGDEICPICGILCGGFRKQILPEDMTFGSRGGFEPSGAPALNDSAPTDVSLSPELVSFEV